MRAYILAGVMYLLCPVLPVALYLLVPTTVSAQSYSTSSIITFQAPTNSGGQAGAQALTYHLRIDGGTALALTSVACAPPAPATGIIPCTAPVPAPAVSFLNVLGMRSVTLSAVHTTAGEGPQSDPFSFVVVPAAPTVTAITP